MHFFATLRVTQGRATILKPCNELKIKENKE